LAALSKKFAEAAEPSYYLGVCQLFLNQNDAAVESLEDARRKSGDTLRDDISWYLALALQRSGKTTDAEKELDQLCQSHGEYKDRACKASSELAGR
jgi:hypothetical protein